MHAPFEKKRIGKKKSPWIIINNNNNNNDLIAFPHSGSSMLQVSLIIR
jgi:hypothetical protein